MIRDRGMLYSSRMKNSLAKILVPLALIAACEYAKRISAQGFAREIYGIEILLAAWLCIYLIVTLYIGQYLVRFRKIAVSSIVRDTIKFVIIAIFVAIFLRSVLGWNLAAILTPSAILTAIIGLAMQDTIGNFIAGLLIQTEKPFHLGDWIEVEGQAGRVRELNWRYTKIETLDRYYVVVPNNKIATQKLVNYSKPTPEVNEFLTVGVSYAVPPLKVKRAIESILDTNPNIVKDTHSGVFLHEYSDSSITYKIKYAIREFEIHRQVRDEVLSAIWYQFKKQSIEIPFPIRTVIMQRQTDRTADHHLADLLGKIPFFNGASKAGINNLLHCGLIRNFAAHEQVFDANEDGDAMFFILDGGFNVIRDGKTVSTLGKGDFFGEMSLLTGERRTARVEAADSGSLLEVDRNAFRVLLDSEPSVMGQIENIFNQRVLANKGSQAGSAQIETARKTMLERFKKLFFRQPC